MPELEKHLLQSCVKNSTRKLAQIENRNKCLQLIDLIYLGVNKDGS